MHLSIFSDVSTVFPLCSLTLGNNLMSSFYGEDVHLAEVDSRTTRTCFRLLAAIPPVIMAYFITDLGLITRISGICGFAIGFVFPALLAYTSERKMAALNLPIKTRYSSIFTSYTNIMITLFVSLSFLILFAVMAFTG